MKPRGGRISDVDENRSMGMIFLSAWLSTMGRTRNGMGEWEGGVGGGRELATEALGSGLGRRRPLKTAPTDATLLLPEVP